MIARFNEKLARLLPDGMRGRASYPMPYQDEDGNWIEHPDDAVAIRVSRYAQHSPVCLCVDIIAREEDLNLDDDHFSERLLRPALFALERMP